MQEKYLKLKTLVSFYYILSHFIARFVYPKLILWKAKRKSYSENWERNQLDKKKKNKSIGIVSWKYETEVISGLKLKLSYHYQMMETCVCLDYMQVGQQPLHLHSLHFFQDWSLPTCPKLLHLLFLSLHHSLQKWSKVLVTNQLFIDDNKIKFYIWSKNNLKIKF